MIDSQRVAGHEATSTPTPSSMSDLYHGAWQHLCWQQTTGRSYHKWSQGMKTRIATVGYIKPCTRSNTIIIA